MMAKKLITTLFLIITSQFCFSQKSKYPKLYILDSNFIPSKDMSANGYLIEVDKFNDTTFQKSYYSQNTLKVLAVETYRNETDEIGNGLFAYYNNNGILDSMGDVSNGKRIGKWQFYDSHSKKYDSVIKTIEYDKNGKRILIEKDTTIKGTKVEVESSFNGNWRKYLEKNIKYPDNALKINAQGTVKVLFTVSEKGELINGIFLQASQNYFLDKEAIRVIKKSSGSWNPGKVNGIPVNSYHLQPIIFALGNGY